MKVIYFRGVNDFIWGNWGRFIDIVIGKIYF